MDYEIYKALEQLDQEDRQETREYANCEFAFAKDLATESGLILKQHSDAHYQIMPLDKSFIINIYPGNRRIYQDRAKPGPYLDLPITWTLKDVVVATAKAVKHGS